MSTVTHDAPSHVDVSPARPALATVGFGAVGLAAAVLQIVTGVQAEVVAITVVAATLCYLAAAALERPWVAWATILGASVVIVLGEAAGLPWWGGAALAAAVLVAVALLRRSRREAVVRQGLAFVGYGGVAVVGVHLAPTAGLLVVGAALAAHAAWDVVHWRRDVVVPRSLAEFCIVLDLTLGAAAVLAALAR